MTDHLPFQGCHEIAREINERHIAIVMELIFIYSSHPITLQHWDEGSLEMNVLAVLTWTGMSSGLILPLLTVGVQT